MNVLKFPIRKKFPDIQFPEDFTFPRFEDAIEDEYDKGAVEIIALIPHSFEMEFIGLVIKKSCPNCGSHWDDTFGCDVCTLSPEDLFSY